MLRKIFFILLTIINLNSFANDSQSNLHASYIFYYKNMAAGTMDLKMQNVNKKIRFFQLAHPFLVRQCIFRYFVSPVAREKKIKKKKKDKKFIKVSY